MKKLILLLLVMIPGVSNAQFSKYHIGGDVGYTTNNFINMDISVSIGKWYCGFSAQINADTGVKGKSYDKIINWDNDLDAVSDSGKYYADSYGLDLGYYFKDNLCLGCGIGYASHRLYRNFHDDTQILHESGWYHVTKSDGGKIDTKIFLNIILRKI